MNKRAIAILGAIFILIVGTLGFLIFQRSQKSKKAELQNQANNQAQPQPVENTDPAPIEQPQPEDPAPANRAVKLTDDEVISPVLFFQGDAVTFFNSQGQLFQTDLTASGNTVLLSNKRELTIALKSGITKILWPVSGNNFIAEFDTGSKTYWSFFDSDRGEYTGMPSEVVAVNWLPSSDRILLVWVDGQGRASLNSANPDLSGYQTLTQLYEPDDAISVSPDGKTILFWRTKNRDGRNQIGSLSIDGKIFNAVVADGYNLGVKWSSDSRKFVFGRRGQSETFELWLADVSTGQVKTLGVNTIPEKVVWSKDGQNVFAGVPDQGNPGGGLTQDTIVKINTNTAAKTEYPTGTAVDAADLFLSNSEDVLYFKNRQDRALYYIDVAQ